jgi:hypothetical protein
MLTLCMMMVIGTAAVSQSRGAAQAELVNQPDAVEVVRAYATLRQWLDEFTAPPVESPQAKVKLSNSSGVCIVLRRSGRVLGIGTDVVADDMMLRRAAAQAMSQVLSDQALRGMLTRIGSDKKNPNSAQDVAQLQREIGRSICIELEVAGKRSPLIGQSLEQMASKLDPGVDGAAMRVNQDWHVAFPSQLRSANASQEPERVLEKLVLTSSFPLKDVRTISQRNDVGMYSFRSITLSQSEPNRQPNQLFRGDIIVPQSAVTSQSVAKLANRIALHLVNSMWPEPAPGEQGARLHQPQPLGVMGDYEIATDRTQPLFAPPLEQALAAFALHRYAKVEVIDDAIAASAMQCAMRILRELAQVTDREIDPFSQPLACAAIVYAVSEMPALRTDPVVGPLFRQAARIVVDSFSDAGIFATARVVTSTTLPVPPMSQAMLAGALMRLLAMNEESFTRLDREFVRKALDAAWASAPSNEHVELLPWIGWAETEYARHTRQPLKHADDLRKLIEMLEQSRIGSGRPASLDLQGGLNLVSASSSNIGSPRATSQTLRPATWLMSVPSNPLYAEFVNTGQLQQGNSSTLRFLMQLTVREPFAIPLRDAKRALGGVRQSAWNSAQPVAAQALGLITASEYLLSSNQTP